MIESLRQFFAFCVLALCYLLRDRRRDHEWDAQEMEDRYLDFLP